MDGIVNNGEKNELRIAVHHEKHDGPEGADMRVNEPTRHGEGTVAENHSKCALVCAVSDYLRSIHQ